MKEGCFSCDVLLLKSMEQHSLKQFKPVTIWKLLDAKRPNLHTMSPKRVSVGLGLYTPVLLKSKQEKYFWQLYDSTGVTS